MKKFHALPSSCFPQQEEIRNENKKKIKNVNKFSDKENKKKKYFNRFQQKFDEIFP